MGYNRGTRVGQLFEDLIVGKHCRQGGGGGWALKITGARRSGRGPDCVTYVFVSLGSITIRPLYKLTLSDQPRVTLQLEGRLSDLVYWFLTGPPLLGGGTEKIFLRIPNPLSVALLVNTVSEYILCKIIFHLFQCVDIYSILRWLPAAMSDTNKTTTQTLLTTALAASVYIRRLDTPGVEQSCSPRDQSVVCHTLTAASGRNHKHVHYFHAIAVGI
jgi:hypothetical protein